MALATPDITTAQFIALGGSVIDVLVQFGVHLSSGQQHSLLGILGVLATIVASDAHIRKGRSAIASTDALRRNIAN